MARILVVLSALCVMCGTLRAATVKGRVVEAGFRVAELGVGFVDTWPPPTLVQDGDGRFTIEDAPPGKHRLAIVGWAFAKREMTIDVPRTGTLDLGTIEVEAGRRVTGRVLSSDGSAILGATVLVYTAKPVDLDDPIALMVDDVRIATTGFDGTFLLEGVPETTGLRMLAIADDLTSSEYLVPEHHAANIELVAGKLGAIAGKVTNPRALRSPAVTATPVGFTGKPMIAGIDRTGTFHFDLPAGVYDLTLVDEKQAPLQVVVVGERESHAQLVAPTRHASLTVVAPDCILVQLRAARPHERVPRTEIALDVCDADRVTFSDLPFGPYQVCIDGDDERCTSLTLRAAQTLRVAPPKH